MTLKILILCFICILLVLYVLTLKKENFTSNKKMLKFIHITKTGGTSIENIGLKHGIKWGRFDTEMLKHFDKKESLSIWHYPFTLLDKKYKQKYDWFLVVRNPYDRVLSEYYCPWNRKGEYVKHTTNKKEFNDIIYSKIIEKLSGFKRVSFEPHYRYIDKSVKIHVLKFENLKNDFDSLMKKYNLDIKLDLHTNKGNNKLFSIADFSPKLVKLINRVYDKDFKLFGYKKLYTTY